MYCTIDMPYSSQYSDNQNFYVNKCFNLDKQMIRHFPFITVPQKDGSCGINPINPSFVGSLIKLNVNRPLGSDQKV